MEACTVSAMLVPKSTSVSTAPSNSMEMVDLISQPRFHQSLTLQATATHGELTVQYAVAGVNDENAPMILFCGGMFCGSWIVAALDYLAVKCGVRICCIDRPSFGSSTPVPLAQRILVWLETLPPLLQAIKAPRVSLLSHSAGTLYILHTLYYLPHILDPRAPYAALFTPWVHPAHSSVKLLSAATLLPAALIGNYWASICTSSLQLPMLSAPMIDSSSLALGSIAELFQSKTHKLKSDEERTALDKRFREATGMRLREREEFDRLVMKKGVEAGVAGANDEALLCLKKCEAGLWGVADDYEKYAADLGAAWNLYLKQEEGEVIPGSKLWLRAYFAEDDTMIGKRGQEYFESCFGGEKCGESIDYKSFTVEGTDHNTMLHPVYGPLGKVFEEIGNRARL